MSIGDLQSQDSTVSKRFEDGNEYQKYKASNYPADVDLSSGGTHKEQITTIS